MWDRSRARPGSPEIFAAAAPSVLRGPIPGWHNGYKVPFTKAPLKRALRRRAG
jgi:hypothetical protein